MSRSSSDAARWLSFVAASLAVFASACDSTRCVRNSDCAPVQACVATACVSTADASADVLDAVVADTSTVADVPRDAGVEAGSATDVADVADVPAATLDTGTFDAGVDSGTAADAGSAADTGPAAPMDASVTDADVSDVPADGADASPE